MLITFLVIVGYLIICLVELLPLYKEKRKKEAVVYAAIISFCLVINILITLDVKIPSPSDAIESAVNMIIGKQGK